MDYLPRDFANRFASSRIIQRDISKEDSEPSTSDQRSTPFYQAPRLTQVARPRKDLAEAIIGQLLEDIQGKVDQEASNDGFPSQPDLGSLPQDIQSPRFLAQ